LLTECTHNLSFEFMLYDWDPEKEQWLREHRGVSFLHVLHHIERGDLLDVREHHNKRKHPGQRLFIVRMGGYVYIVPFVMDDTTIFLKTIIPSRKETRRYLK
jgi:uncharacterized DUF497 family protein